MTIQETMAQGGAVDLVELAKRHMEDGKLSIKELAGRLNLSRSMVSQYLSGDYSKPETVEERLVPYLDEQRIAISPVNPGEVLEGVRPGEQFFQSADARRVMAVCGACQEFAALGIITGRSGYGKTHTLKQYAKLPKVAYIECDDTMGRVDLVESLEAALGMNRGYGSLCRRTNNIVAALNRTPGVLIIVDEADKLISRSSIKKLEILRKLVDQAKVGLVIAGEPQLKPLLEAYDFRFASRGTYGYSLDGLTKEEAGRYLAPLPMDQAAKEVLTARACGGRNGCFRLLDRTLGSVLRLAKARGADRITLDMVEEASDMMIL